MQQDTPSTLDVMYKKWRGYNGRLQNCIVPLTSECTAQQSVHLTGGMASANALALGDVRRRLTRPICGIFRLHLHSSRILLSKFCPRPPTRK